MGTSYFYFLIGDYYEDVDGRNFYSNIVVWFGLLGCSCCVKFIMDWIQDWKMLCSHRLRIAILNEEISLWEKRLSDNPDDIPYLGYIRTTLKGRVKELEVEEKKLDILV